MQGKSRFCANTYFMYQFWQGPIKLLNVVASLMELALGERRNSDCSNQMNHLMEIAQFRAFDY